MFCTSGFRADIKLKHWQPSWEFLFLKIENYPCDPRQMHISLFSMAIRAAIPAHAGFSKGSSLPTTYCLQDPHRSGIYAEGEWSLGDHRECVENRAALAT